MRKLCFGFIWFFVFASAILTVGGFIVGVQAAMNNPDSSQAAAAAAGQVFAQTHAGKIFLAALVIAVIGSVSGWLPGTRKRQT